MGKTDSINDRRVDVYLESVEKKQRWSELAEDADMSLSKFVQACVQYAISQGGPDFIEAGESAEEIQEMQKELNERKKSIEEKNAVIEKLKTELKQHRTQSFLEDDFEGRRRYDTELIELLKSSNTIRSEEILQRLDVDAQNIEIIEAIQQQLKQLEEYGLVEETVHGWRWNG